MHSTCSSHVHLYDRSGKSMRVKGLMHVFFFIDDAMYIKQIGKNNLVFFIIKQMCEIDTRKERNEIEEFFLL